MQTVTQIKPAPNVVEQAGGRSGGGGGSSGTLWGLGRPVPLGTPGNHPDEPPKQGRQQRFHHPHFPRKNLELAILPWGRTLGEARSHIVLDD